MRTFSVEARDLPDAWFQCVDLCYESGRDYEITEGSYVGQKRRELDYVTVHITHPQMRPLLPDVPAHYNIPNPVEDDYVERYLPYLMTAEKKPGEQYTYGERLFRKLFCGSSDKVTGLATDMPSQVDEVIAKFRRGFANNQATMTVARPSDVHLDDPPCLRQIDCRIFPAGVTNRDTAPADFSSDANKLHFMIYFRSWDLWAGFPANLAALAHLQEYMAGEIGVEPGEFICASKGLHLYDHFWELARVRLGA